MLTLGAALRQATELLERGGIAPARLTAEVLLAHAVRCDRSYLYAHPERPLREVEWIHFGRYLHERLGHKPLQYITGRQEFYGREFLVTSDVLIPRPETELLVETALPLAKTGLTVDMGTGSGAIAVTLALEGARRVVGVDVSEAALAMARRNADALGAPVEFVCGDALSALGTRTAELMVSNPPYLAQEMLPGLQAEVRDWEPRLALAAGSEGLDFYRRLVPEAARVLRPGGYLALELGAGQAAAVTQLLDERWNAPVRFQDLAGIERVILIQLKLVQLKDSGTL